MSPLNIFLCGFAGSLAVEIVNLNQAYEQHDRGDEQHDTSLPRRYYNPWFWVARVLLALVGGGLALAYRIQDNPLLAANVGVATPLIIQALGRGIKVPPMALTAPSSPIVSPEQL